MNTYNLNKLMVINKINMSVYVVIYINKIGQLSNMILMITILLVSVIKRK